MTFENKLGFKLDTMGINVQYRYYALTLNVCDSLRTIVVEQGETRDCS